MNAKPWRSRSWNSGITRTPATPQTTAIARPHVAQLAAVAPCPLRSTITASMRWRCDLDPLALDGGPASGGSSSSRSRRARSRRDRRPGAARPAGRRAGSPSATSSSSTCPSACSVGAEIRIAIDDGSSLLRPMSNFSTSNDALRLTTVSNTTLRICESIRWPSASTTSLNGGARRMRSCHQAKIGSDSGGCTW